MRSDIIKIRDDIVLAALPSVPFDGWRWSGLETAAVESGYDKDMPSSVFPQGLTDAVDHFADWADRQMLESLKNTDPISLRVRDRIKTCVLTRLDVLEPYKEAVRYSAAYWAIPGRQGRASKALWRTSDRMWTWAGDESEDYNYYTKRGLLSSIIAPTTLVWLEDPQTSEQGSKTETFLEARIENVLKIGGRAGKTISKITEIRPLKGLTETIFSRRKDSL